MAGSGAWSLYLPCINWSNELRLYFLMSDEGENSIKCSLLVARTVGGTILYGH